MWTVHTVASLFTAQFKLTLRLKLCSLCKHLITAGLKSESQVETSRVGVGLKILGVRQVRGLEPLLLNLSSPPLPQKCLCPPLPFLLALGDQLVSHPPVASNQ